jgi:hypothetical protein
MAATESHELVMITARAQVQETVLSDEWIRTAINAALEKASTDTAAANDPIGPNQKPRMLHLSAFICHAGQPNRNGAGFLAEDLQEAVDSGLFAAPYFGMIDWNHDFTAYGCWYRAEWAFDTKANEWGILAHGALFAWRYGDIADKVLAMQARQGWVDVSMSCMPGWYEPAVDQGGTPYRMIRKPVFFTTSLLDVDPADPNGRGTATEDPASTPEDRTRELSQASLYKNGTDTEENMDELIAKVEAMLGEQRQELAPLVEAALKLPEAETALAETTEQLSVAQTALTELESAKSAVETAKAELEVAHEALKSEVASITEELTALREFKAAMDSAEAERVEMAKRDARLSQVPDAMIDALEKSAKKDEIVADWMKLSDDEWQLRLESFSLAGANRKSLADRTAEEGSLSSMKDGVEGSFAITRWRKVSK